MALRYLGIDVGAETVKLVELTRRGADLVWTRRAVLDHGKEPAAALLEALSDWDLEDMHGAAASGRSSRMLALPRIPTKQAQASGFGFLCHSGPGAVVSIGAHGFSVLELRGGDVAVFRQNSRCSQGTGNFLRQLIERFDLDIEAASDLCADVEDPAPLSGRCPVILKTDMTHLANKGEHRARILAGLYDAVCENVQVLVNPRTCPTDVLLVGGVTRSRRIRDNFARFLARHDKHLLSVDPEDALFVEALGCAVIAAEDPIEVPSRANLLTPVEHAGLERVPALSRYLDQVCRMPTAPLVDSGQPLQLVLGFDMGSTGSKAVALDAASRRPAWHSYVNTNGDPVGAAQVLMRRFTESPAARHPVLAAGVTGSGREIVGSLLSTCYGPESVFILNEIAAHAVGALSYDERVDTIFEIGGQDAKYIRLVDGRVVDAAMNEACSAGTGSFIEEQGRKFSGIEDVVHLGQEAMNAQCGVSLGQHCSVFMAEIIDEAVALGVEQQTIIAGIYDSIVQNYLNRVKGSRSVGQVIFTQGMPFSSDALAAAVARQTGSEVIVPPEPGGVGALGIALLTLGEVEVQGRPPIDPQRFLDARVDSKDVFICKATRGCGGSGNKCRIDRLATVVEGRRRRFLWGGSCSLYDRGTGKEKLPDRAPHPFRERADLLGEVRERVSAHRGRPRIALTDQFHLNGLFPFFATFLFELGLDPLVHSEGGHRELKRGIEEANVPFCAPMQLYQGVVSTMAEAGEERLFLPMIRTLTPAGDEERAVLCPVVQGSADITGANLREQAGRVWSPVVDFGREGMSSREFVSSCQRIAADLGVEGEGWAAAFEEAHRTQRTFEDRCLAIGRHALAFCNEQGITPVVVLGRAYTIHNDVLNSNVPSILREQGAMAIPVDCYPLDGDVPVFRDIYWAFVQRNLRAAHQIRRTPGVYSMWCSNYACGPDSFGIHFYSYIMEGKPFAIIETDGHAGDAGTKTRVEAFLFCVREDLRHARDQRANRFTDMTHTKATMADMRRHGVTLLMPRMGPAAEGAAAALRGFGLKAECLPMPDREAVRLGRRHTSGKECVPMCITLGSLLQRLDGERQSDDRFVFFMPTTCGPCRFGVYHLLHKIVLERLGLKDRVQIFSPHDRNYFDGVPPGAEGLLYTGAVAHDVLSQAYYDARPTETRPGAAEEIYRRHVAELNAVLERVRSPSELSVAALLWEVATGRLFGLADLLARAARQLAAVKTDRPVPTVFVAGEIYVRMDPFANDFVLDRLTRRGIRARMAPVHEWLEYCDWFWLKVGGRKGIGPRFKRAAKTRIANVLYNAAAAPLGWPDRPRIEEALFAAGPYVREELEGEAVLTVGGPVHEWQGGHIDGLVSVGPLECMPNKVAEAQLFHVHEREGLLSLTLPLNGDPVDPELLDNFAYEVHARFRATRR